MPKMLVQVKNNRSEIGIYSDTSKIFRNCAIQHKGREMKINAISEKYRVKSNDNGIVTEETPASKTHSEEDQHKEPTPVITSWSVRGRLISELQHYRNSVVVLTIFVFALAFLITGCSFYFLLRSQMRHGKVDLTNLLPPLPDTPKVAFSASLRGSGNFTLGPFRYFHILVYKHVYTNVGGAYNESTGVFTVPVQGVYQFSFSAYGRNPTTKRITCGVLLLLNGAYIISSYDNNPGLGRMAVNTNSMELKVGDRVYMGLSKYRVLHVSPQRYILFSGALVFPL